MEIMSFDEFIAKSKESGVEWAKKTLRDYVLEGEPVEFCDGATSRAMCREASDAITGEKSLCCLTSKHGMDMFFYMWGGD